MEGLSIRDGGGKKTVRWAPYMEELYNSDFSSLELMPIESSSVEKEGKCGSPVRTLVLNGTGSSYVVPTVLWYFSSNSEKNEGEPWNGDMYLYAAIIPRMYIAVMSYDLWPKKLNGDYSAKNARGGVDIGTVR